MVGNVLVHMLNVLFQQEHNELQCRKSKIEFSHQFGEQFWRAKTPLDIADDRVVYDHISSVLLFHCYETWLGKIHDVWLVPS